MSERDERIDKAAAEAGLSQEQIVQSDIEQARADLAETVDALAGKLDVKAQASHKVAEAKQKAADTATRMKQSAPPPVQHALDVAGEKGRPLVQKAEPHRNKIIAGVAVAVVLVLIVRKMRRGD
jgi:hypothetical protein